MPSPGREGGTRTGRQELAPSLSRLPWPTTGHLKVLVPGKKGGGRGGEVAQQCHQFLPLARLGAVPGAAGLTSRAGDFHPLARSLR